MGAKNSFIKLLLFIRHILSTFVFYLILDTFIDFGLVTFLAIKLTDIALLLALIIFFYTDYYSAVNINYCMDD